MAPFATAKVILFLKQQKISHEENYKYPTKLTKLTKKTLCASCALREQKISHKAHKENFVNFVCFVGTKRKSSWEQKIFP
ncbi:MAG: hypothetical protein LBC98_08725 [Prevotellaceae bacterium]|jgi:hypothetical protein|nr:hypothetical protein [Prevotellaceae bacterium]